MAARAIGQIIDDYLAEGPYAVYGASRHRWKYGNKILRAYLQAGLPVTPIHPEVEEVEGQRAYPTLSALPEVPRGISFITPPPITEQGVAEAIAVGASFVWMQPGAESAEAVRLAREAGLEVIADGSCLLVVLGYRE